jgi:type II secretory pathway pseudopilin PulG
MYKFLIKNKINFSKEVTMPTNISAGFTLIELMVATSIFISIMLMAMGTLIISSDTNKRAEQLRLSMDNVNFAMESMTRSIRMGSNYYCSDSNIPLDLSSGGNDCPNGGKIFTFTPADNMNKMGGNLIAYQLSEDSLQRCSDSSNCENMTSPGVKIDYLRFFVNGTSTGDFMQPSAYIVMKGSVTVKGETTSFALQTMASQRSSE